MPEQPKLFTREATGLVKEVSPWSSFLATFGLVTGGVPILIINTLYTAPGANWTLAFTIAFLPSLSLAVLATIIAISMPRSGADYVFTSRALNPGLGFVNYFGLAAAWIIANGIFQFYGTQYLGYLLASLGIFWSNPGLISAGSFVTAKVPAFVITVGQLVFGGALAIFRPRIVWGFVFWTGLLAIIATLVMFGAFASITPASFHTAYNSFAQSHNFTSYEGVLSSAGLQSPGLLPATAAALPFAWFAFTWYTLPVTWAGEIKNVKRSMWITIVGALIWIAAYFILFVVFVFGAFGQNFLEAWSNVSIAGAGSPVPGIGTYVPFFAYLVIPNIAIFAIIFYALWMPNFNSTPPLIISQTRYLFSWAWDRVLPERLADVSDRFHTPVLASVIVTAGCILGAFLYDFYPNLGLSISIYPIFTFGFLIPAIAAAVFPYTSRSLYESSIIVKRKVAGIPIMTWLGVGTAIYLVYSTYLAISSGALPLNLTSGLTYSAIYVLAALIYVWGYYNAKRKGIPLDLIFKEIPPE